MRLVPISTDDAKAFVALCHRHLPNPPSIAACVAVAAEHDGAVVGVAMGGRPMAPGHDDGLLFEIHRVAVMPDAPKGASSMLIQAMRRAAGALGYNRATTTTLASESGASLRGAGWRQTTFLEPRGGWDCKARARKPGPCDRVAKLRWEVVINTETHSPNTVFDRSQTGEPVRTAEGRTGDMRQDGGTNGDGAGKRINDQDVERSGK